MAGPRNMRPAMARPSPSDEGMDTMRVLVDVARTASGARWGIPQYLVASDSCPANGTTVLTINVLVNTWIDWFGWNPLGSSGSPVGLVNLRIANQTVFQATNNIPMNVSGLFTPFDFFGARRSMFVNQGVTVQGTFVNLNGSAQDVSLMVQGYSDSGPA